jgi:hypothetical protein
MKEIHTLTYKMGAKIHFVVLSKVLVPTFVIKINRKFRQMQVFFQNLRLVCVFSQKLPLFR